MTVQEPMYVRYAWADNPDEANLYNKEDSCPRWPCQTRGLNLASPFRTINKQDQ